MTLFKSPLHPLSFLLLLSVFLYSCENKESKATMMAEMLHEKNCKIEEINKFIDSSWDTSLEELETLLPENMPEEQKNGMLVLKNAEMIRHFEQYDHFSPEAIKVVSDMEELDRKWADSVRVLNNESQNLELKLDSLMSTVTSAESLELMMQKIKEVREKPCDQVTL